MLQEFRAQLKNEILAELADPVRQRQAVEARAGAKHYMKNRAALLWGGGKEPASQDVLDYLFEVADRIFGREP